MAGKKKKLKREYFVQLGEGLGLTPKQIKGGFNRLLKNKPKACIQIRKLLRTQ